MTASRIPVTVLTGFLGSGKTTLLNRILSEHHGQRIAVIENEFGEIGIDQALVIKADEEIFEMNNGCICCTVRGDLIRVLGNLMKRRDKFDRIVVETTGMANPGPVAQTFFVDEDIRGDFALDGIITLVDAKHLEQHLGEQQEAFEQVAFADVLVVNKIDLVDNQHVDALEKRLRSVNAMAKIVRGSHGQIPLEQVLDVGGFDLDRALAMRPAFLEPEYPFEWAGAYELAAGSYELALSPGPDPSMRVLVERIVEGTSDELARVAERVFRRMSGDAPVISNGGGIPVDGRPVDVEVAPELARTTARLSLVETGRYALFTQHLPDEFSLALLDARGGEVGVIGERAFAAAHTHDDAVGSVGLEFDRPFDEKKLNAWLGRLLRERGNDIFRMKGILAIAGAERRFVFQAVHMLLDGRPDRAWGDAPRTSQLVFIGKGLERASLREGLAACLA